LSASVTASACAPEDQNSNTSHDESVIGPGHVFEAAKGKAIGTADGIIVTNVEVNYVNGNVCTTVRGRPYTIQTVQAVPPGGKQLVELNGGAAGGSGSGPTVAPNF
jgi:hypothetical protein